MSRDENRPLAPDTMHRYGSPAKLACRLFIKTDICLLINCRRLNATGSFTSYIFGALRTGNEMGNIFFTIHSVGSRSREFFLDRSVRVSKGFICCHQCLPCRKNFASQICVLYKLFADIKTARTGYRRTIESFPRSYVQVERTGYLSLKSSARWPYGGRIRAS